jgi:hypothetical protein
VELTQPSPSKIANNTPIIPPVESKVRDVQVDARKENRGSVARNVRGRTALEGQLQAYGLPCAECHLYYPAGLDCCPVCNSRERVSPHVVAAKPKVQQAPPREQNTTDLEREREEFLKQLKSQVAANDSEIAASSAFCTLPEHHTEGVEPAAICKPCYEALQERLDVFEAALHIDLKEAAQIVYDAVWADPSDPSKTYANAAGALLAELRKRSGASSLLGPFQPLDN